MKKNDNDFKMNILKNKKNIFFIASIFIVFLLIISTTTINIVNYNKERKKAEEMSEISYIVQNIDYYTYDCNVVVSFANQNGIDQITDFEGKTIKTNGKMIVAIDYVMIDGETYTFDILYNDGTEKTLPLHFTIPRKTGDYSGDIGLVYANKPDMSGFEELNTRYMYMVDEVMKPGNWINDVAPTNWYDYSEKKWANVFVENEGMETYFVWIPRYCYKCNSNNTTDVLFINMNNEYINKQTNETIGWSQLKEEGYIIPDAFTWYSSNEGLTWIPGYWITKYQLADKPSLNINWHYTVNETSAMVDIDETDIEGIRYCYALNGDIKTTTEDRNYTFTGLTDGTNYINVTAINTDGTIVASMTKKVELVAPNPPDLSGFEPDTTFYVCYDENGVENCDTPISMNAPANWYNYAERKWANVVTKNNGLTTYFVWIPRFEYYFNSDIAAIEAPNQRTTVKFLRGTAEAEPGFILPDSFIFNGEDITGYWITKYQLRD